MKLREGGNAFKDENKNVLTQRINQQDIAPTIAWLEKETGLDFTMDKDENNVPIKWLGTTGRKESSGDLDLSVNANEVDKKELAALLKQKFGKDSVRLTGDAVHLKTPIKGDESNGFVQTDFMFSANPKFQQGSMRGEPGAYRGEHRHILLSSIARAQNMKYSPKFGLVDPDTNEPLNQGDDWDFIAKQLLDPSADSSNIRSVEAIIQTIKSRPDYNQLVAAARETLGKSNVSLPESYADKEFSRMVELTAFLVK